MALLPGYEYDIFISYRHNDNLNGWVSGFVEALEKELKATVKEPLSIYFDKNPHDGLLETHHVDKSLEGKLKCLIFIPIISQTYCDEKSFAWQHEFCAFNTVAKGDELGRDVRLLNGNVASRILPVKIHDLDATDKAIIENELGGALRAIEFIYKEPGVNRPLKPTDTRADNQNKTDYRNQINKVANAVKELITALKSPRSPATTNHHQPTAKPTSSGKKILAALGAVILLATAYFFYQQRTTTAQPPALDKSIAVLPFTDMSPNHDYEYFGDGLSEEIINTLTSVEELKVIARYSSFEFKNRNENVGTIGKILNVGFVLQGSIRPAGETLRITAQLVRTSDGKTMWSKSYNRKSADVLSVQAEVSLQIANQLQASLDIRPKPKPWDERALKLYQKGRFFWDRASRDDRDRAVELFTQALQYDSGQSVLYALLAAHYSGRKDDAKAEQYISRALTVDSSSAEAHVTYARILRSRLMFHEALNHTVKALKNGSTEPLVLRVSGRTYTLFGDSKKGIALAKRAVDLDPLLAYSQYQLGYSYYMSGNYDSAIVQFQKAHELSSDFVVIQGNIAQAHLLMGRVENARQIIKSETDSLIKLSVECMIQHASGNAKAAQQLLNSFASKYGKNEPYEVAVICSFMQRTDDAFYWLENAVSQKDLLLENALVEPFFANIRNEERYKAIIKRLGFPKLVEYQD